MQIAYSWSRLDDFEKCPLLCYWKSFAPKAQRIPFTENPATKRGKALHKELELSVRGKPLIQELSHVQPIMSGIHAKMRDGYDVTAEQQVAFTRNYEICSWFDKDCYLRIIFDVVMKKGADGVIWDWKTGKVREKSDQLKLCAMGLMIMHPSIEQVSSSYIFVDHKKAVSAVYRRDCLPEIIEEFEERADMIQIASDNNNWPANPSDFNCRWCPCNRAQCQYVRN